MNMMLLLKSLLYNCCGIPAVVISERDTSIMFLCRKFIQKISVVIVTETIEYLLLILKLRNVYF